MKLEKAIELGNKLPLAINTESDHDNHVAVQLLIEAGKAIASTRQVGLVGLMGSSVIISPLLPGETKE